MTTCRGNHDLEAIFTYVMSGPGEEIVVRWCRRCGAAVIDIDVDGRISPGAYMAMRLPKTEEALQGRT
jgi:hypothetical protein